MDLKKKKGDLKASKLKKSVFINNADLFRGGLSDILYAEEDEESKPVKKLRHFSSFNLKIKYSYQDLKYQILFVDFELTEMTLKTAKAI